MLFRCNECNYWTKRKYNLDRHKRQIHPRSANLRVYVAPSKQRRNSTNISVEDFHNPELNPNPELLDQYRVELHQNNRVLKNNFLDLKVMFNQNDLNYPDNMGYGDLVNLIHGVFQNILAIFTRFLRVYDLIRVVMISEPQLSPPCSIPFLPVSELSAEVCSSAIAAILNSKNNFSLDNFKIHFISSEQPKPMGGDKKSLLKNRKIMDIKQFYKNKKSVISVPDLGDFLCAGRALLTAVKLLKKDPQITAPNHRYRHLNSSKFTQETINLYRKQMVNWRKRSTLHGVVKLLDNEIFNDISGLNVFSTEEGLERTLYIKRDGDLGYINLLQLENHYYVISKINEFFGSKGFCLDCGKPYIKFKHFCPANQKLLCKYCKNPNCENVDSVKEGLLICDGCERIFYSAVSDFLKN